MRIVASQTGPPTCHPHLHWPVTWFILQSYQKSPAIIMTSVSNEKYEHTLGISPDILHTNASIEARKEALDSESEQRLTGVLCTCWELITRWHWVHITGAVVLVTILHLSTVTPSLYNLLTALPAALNLSKVTSASEVPYLSHESSHLNSKLLSQWETSVNQFLHELISKQQALSICLSCLAVLHVQPATIYTFYTPL